MKTKKRKPSHQKTIPVTIKLVVDRNEFIASRTIGEDIDPSFRNVEGMTAQEVNELVYATVWVEAIHSLRNMHESVGLVGD